METDIMVQVVEKLWAGEFSLQLYELTDISGHAQLVAFSRYADSGIKEHILFCKGLEVTTTDWDTFNIGSSFFLDNGIKLKCCISVCGYSSSDDRLCQRTRCAQKGGKPRRAVDTLHYSQRGSGFKEDEPRTSFRFEQCRNFK